MPLLAGSSFSFRLEVRPLRAWVKATVREVVPGRHVICQARAWGLAGEQAWLFDPMPAGGVRVTCRQELGGYLLSLLPALPLRPLEAVFDGWLRGLKAQAEDEVMGLAPLDRT